jgi:hypothetical protein
MRVYYRATVFQRKTPADFTETVPLKPRAGSAHNDDFKVTTHPNLPGWKSYLEIRSGRSGSIDPRTFSANIGEFVFIVLDKRVVSTDNVTRWVTTFLGDSSGRVQLLGCRVLLEESLDDGLTWQPHFGGRITRPAAPSASKEGPIFSITVKDQRVEEYRTVFAGPPHKSVLYASPSPLWPIGTKNPVAVDQFRASFPALAGGMYTKLKLQNPFPPAHPLYQQSGQNSKYNFAFLRVDIPNVAKARVAYFSTKALFDLAEYREDSSPRSIEAGGEICPYVLVHLVSNVEGQYGKPGAMTDHGYFYLAKIDEATKSWGGFVDSKSAYDERKWSPLYVTMSGDKGIPHAFGMRQLPVTHIQRGTWPSEITGRSFFAAFYNGGPARADAPILISPVAAPIFYRDMLEGKFSGLDPMTGQVAYTPIQQDETAVDLLLSSTYQSSVRQIPEVMYAIQEPTDIKPFTEGKLFPAAHIGSVIQRDGKIKLVDLAIPPYGSIVDIRTIDRTSYSTADWSGGDDTITLINAIGRAYGFHEEFFTEIWNPNSSEGTKEIQSPLDVNSAGFKIFDQKIPFPSPLAHLLPLATHQMDTSGLIIGYDFTAKDAPIEQQREQARLNSTRVRIALEQTVGPMMSKFGTGASYYDMNASRIRLEDKVKFPNGAVQGSWFYVDADEPPNPLNNVRGGIRLMLLIDRQDDGSISKLRFLDAGPDSTATAPTVTNIRLNDADPYTSVLVDVTSQNENDRLELQRARTTLQPPVNSLSWIPHGELLVGPGQAIAELRGPRVWFRARIRPRADRHLGSPWTNFGPADLTVINSKTITVTALSGSRALMIWAPDLENEAEIYLDDASSLANWNVDMLLTTLPPGSSEFLLDRLLPNTTYTVGLRFIRDRNAVSEMQTFTFTTTNIPDKAFRPAGIVIVTGTLLPV